MELASAQDNCSAVGQRFADGFKSFATHDDYLPRGHFFKPLEILRQLPRYFVPLANDAVKRHGGDGLKLFHGPGNETLTSGIQIACKSLNRLSVSAPPSSPSPLNGKTVG